VSSLHPHVPERSSRPLVDNRGQYKRKDYSEFTRNALGSESSQRFKCITGKLVRGSRPTHRLENLFVRWIMIRWIDLIPICMVNCKVPVYHPDPREDHGNLQRTPHADQGDGREHGLRGPTRHRGLPVGHRRAYIGDQRGGREGDRHTHEVDIYDWITFLPMSDGTEPTIAILAGSTLAR
jgi:hypothetical protein